MTEEAANQDPLGEFAHRRREPLAPGQRPCGTCGEPVDAGGRTLQRRKRHGPACPGCGFRMRARTESQTSGLVKFGDRPPGERSELARRAALAGVEKRRAKKDLIAQKMDERAEELADKVVAPYFAGLELVPREEWSPSTKLDFYIKQSVLADKVFNRVEGLPVARQRNVDKDDEDVLRGATAVTPAVARELVLDLLEGRGEVLDAEEGEWTEQEESDAGGDEEAERRAG